MISSNQECPSSKEPAIAQAVWTSDQLSDIAAEFLEKYYSSLDACSREEVIQHSIERMERETEDFTLGFFRTQVRWNANKASDKQNRRKARLRYAYEGGSRGDPTTAWLLGSVRSPEDELLENEDQQRIAQALASLSDELYGVIFCRIYKQMTQADTGKELGITRDKARRLEITAAKALREYLNNKT